jgi:two-component system, NarL family, response regulator LiaR
MIELIAPPSGSPSGEGSTRSERVRVLVADGDGLARRVLCDELRQTEGIVVVAAAQQPRETVELTRHYRPDVLVLDAALPPWGCVEVISQASKVSPRTRILTMSSGDEQTALDAIKAGAIGHISKDLDPQALTGLVLRAAAGEAIIPRRLVMPLLNLVHAAPDSGWRPLRSRLTTREWEIVELLAAGASTQNIADTLFLSATTVYSHIKSVLRKLGVHSRHEAIAAAQRLRELEIAEQPPSP